MGIHNLEIRCVLAFSTKIESTWPFLKIMRRNNPDYLGHNELITDRSGNPYQYFHYTAWGESFAQAEASQGSFSSRFRFNAKELDSETGNYYYGARYYHPKWSVWLGVDPLASKYPHLTPYNFVEGNPVRFIDPTGMGSEDPTIDENFGIKPILGSEGHNHEISLPTVSEESSLNLPQSQMTPPEMWREYGDSYKQEFIPDAMNTANNGSADNKALAEQLEQFIINFNYDRIEGENGRQVELAAYRIYVDGEIIDINLDPKIAGTYLSYPPGYVDNPGIPQKPEYQQVFESFGGAPLQMITQNQKEVMINITLRIAILW